MIFRLAAAIAVGIDLVARVRHAVPHDSYELLSACLVAAFVAEEVVRATLDLLRRAAKKSTFENDS